MKNNLRMFWFLSIFSLLSTVVWGQATLPHYVALNYTPGLDLGAQSGWTSLNSGDILSTAAGGVVPTTTIDEQFTPSANQAYSGNTSCVSTGASTEYVAVSGVYVVRLDAAGSSMVQKILFLK